MHLLILTYLFIRLLYISLCIYSFYFIYSIIYYIFAYVFIIIIYVFINYYIFIH